MTDTAVALRKRSKPLKGGGSATYWLLSWADSQGRRRFEAIGKVGEMSAADAKKKRREKEREFEKGAAPVDRLHKITLRGFLDLDRQAIATDVQPATIASHKAASIRIISALGGDVPVEKITLARLRLFHSFHT